MSSTEVGQAESVGAVIEILETLKLPSNRKTLNKVLDFLDLSDKAYEEIIKNFKFTYERM